jgi:hypothetical protein
MAVITIAEIVRVVFGLKNLRRAPGDAGKLKKITEIKNETVVNHYVQWNGELSMWPGSMHLVVRFTHPIFFYNGSNNFAPRSTTNDNAIGKSEIDILFQKCHNSLFCLAASARF